MPTDHTNDRAGRNRDPDTIDIIDGLNRHSGQLSALLVSITGQGADNFYLLARENQDRLLDCASDLAMRVREAAGRL